ncbi:putative type VI secretion system effector (plasmid) [Robbsia andropogonis]
MTKQPTQGAAQLLRGRIQNLRKMRCRRDFVFTATDRTNMGATAIAAGLAGLGGVAAGLGAMAIDTTEEADLLEFELDGRPVKAWVWISVFKEGDEVEVVAEPDGDGWLGYGIRRISDRIVALHPHCSRGRYAHYRASFWWFLKLVGCLLLALYLLFAAISYFSGDSLQEFGALALEVIPGALISAAIFGVIAYRISRKYLGFVRLAEGIFSVFGWASVKHIDLPAITKKTKLPNDPGALGVLYFRY